MSFSCFRTTYSDLEHPKNVEKILIYKRLRGGKGITNQFFYAEYVLAWKWDVIIYSSDSHHSHQAVITQSSHSHQAVITQSSDSHPYTFNIEWL